MKTLDDIDESVAVALDEAPDGRRWHLRSRRHRLRLIAACVDTMPATPSDNVKHLRAWRRKARKKCGSVILSIIAMAVLSWLIQKLCEWLYARWKERHENEDRAEWSALKTESCLLLQQEEE